jgi:tRNA dimethylallyltransferase
MGQPRSSAVSWRSRSSAPDRTRWRVDSWGVAGTPEATALRSALPELATTSELPPLIVIAGATATGKSALALELARRIGKAEIVSADSRQVYRGMDIGTAKATPAERAAVPHHGLDLVDPDERFAASDYQRTALAALRGIASRGNLGLLVGGTGLYLRAVARGLPLEHGGSDPELRADLEARLASDGLAPLVAELRSRDPLGARRIDERNPRRVVRALERAIISGSATPAPPLGYPAPATWLGLTCEPAEHRRAIEERARQQFASGLLDEAARLRARFGEDLPAFSAMGYREAFDVLAGHGDLECAIAADARRTWAYARRQRTWFRTEPDIAWLPAGPGLPERALAVLAPALGMDSHSASDGPDMLRQR